MPCMTHVYTGLFSQPRHYIDMYMVSSNVVWNKKNTGAELTVLNIVGTSRKDRNSGSKDMSLILVKLTITDYITHTCTVTSYKRKSINWTNKKHLKNVGPIRHCKPPPVLHCHSLGVATVTRRQSHAACGSMSTATSTTMRDRRDRYGPMEWAQRSSFHTTADLNTL